MLRTFLTVSDSPLYRSCDPGWTNSTGTGSQRGEAGHYQVPHHGVQRGCQW